MLAINNYAPRKPRCRTILRRLLLLTMLTALGFNLSASDMIRTVWSYLYSLLEVARSTDTNHVGLLVLDEPRQQQANKVSFSEFAKRAANAKEFKQQIIFLTSEDPETLSTMLTGTQHQYLDFEGKMIQPMDF